VSAHGNSLRALVMVLDKHTPESIIKLNLDTGVPMIYRLNADTSVATKSIYSGQLCTSGKLTADSDR
jgi:2,3-bisphosphoglycerate-dependent phosphoglycerate mutase